MKKTLLLLLSVMGLNMAAQNGTTIEYKFTSSKGIKGNSLVKYTDVGYRSEINMFFAQMPDGGMKLVQIWKKENPDVIYVINEKSKSYSEMKKKEVQQQTDNRTYTVKKLNDEVVNGYKCTHALITEGTETMEVWNTKDIPDYTKYADAMSSNKRLGSAKRNQALKDAGCEGFLVKMIHKNDPREGDMTMELVKIEKATIAKTDFDIPAGYTKTETVQTPGAMQGMKTQQEIMNMSPEERAKYIEEMKKKYGKE
ncbi:MAG: DUF4412 domain-containing protein [Bacteroidetes bacterium]|nr:DUF4412 domain-containing protein [Bacteroidota bacterium]